jgi:hypothetical protein
MSTSVWTWGGEYFGYIDGENLWTHGGRHVGRLNGEEIYGADGKYLGEVKSENRLITAINKKSRPRASFTPFASRIGRVPSMNYVGYVMYVGYEDFPSPKNF